MPSLPLKMANNPLVNHFFGHLRKEKCHVTFSQAHESAAEFPAKF